MAVKIDGPAEQDRMLVWALALSDRSNAASLIYDVIADHSDETLRAWLTATDVVRSAIDEEFVIRHDRDLNGEKWTKER